MLSYIVTETDSLDVFTANSPALASIADRWENVDIYVSTRVVP